MCSTMVWSDEEVFFGSGKVRPDPGLKQGWFIIAFGLIRPDSIPLYYCGSPGAFAVRYPRWLAVRSDHNGFTEAKKIRVFKL